MSQLFKVGQEVQIKTWDQLLETDGSYSDGGDIDNEYSLIFFRSDMRHLCGKVIEVEDLCEDKVHEFTNFTIADWMVNPLTEEVLDSCIRELETKIEHYKEMLKEIEAEKNEEAEKLFEALLSLRRGDKLKVYMRGKEFNYIVTFDGSERVFITNIENGKHLVETNSSVRAAVEAIRRYAGFGYYKRIIYTKKTGEVYEAKF